MLVLLLLLITHEIDLGYNIKYHVADLSEREIVEMEVKKIEAEANYYLFHPYIEAPVEYSPILKKITGEVPIADFLSMKGLKPIRLKLLEMERVNKGVYRVRLLLETLGVSMNKEGKNEIMFDLPLGECNQYEKVEGY